VTLKKAVATVSLSSSWMGRVDGLEVLELLRVESVLRCVERVVSRHSPAFSDGDLESMRHRMDLVLDRQVMIGLRNRVDRAQTSGVVVQEDSSFTDLVVESLPNSAVDLVELLPRKAKTRSIFMANTSS